MNHTTRPRASVEPEDTQGALDAALAALVAATGEFLNGGGADSTRIETLREIHALVLVRQAAHAAAPHAQTDRLIDRFADAVRRKLARAEAKHGWRNAWARDDWNGECQTHLAQHVAKGDPLDVAAYAAFCWHHGWPTNPAIVTASDRQP